MRLERICRALSAAWFVGSVSAYFNIDIPNTQTQWVQGGSNANLVSWTKGLLDDINSFDVELARMSVDGLTLVARNVNTKPSTFNILLQDYPAGDDYFLIFINSTHGVMYATSPRFTILPSGTSPNSTQAEPDKTQPTVTISGGPYPTKVFATTFAAVNGAVGSILGGVGGASTWVGVLAGVGVGVLGGVGLVW
ncbi:hypothetical protein BDQ17DRAFT_1366550 [Cyathus striatus]|nr:hypothetical protein BDQ17DRAFT_1366550 [Cyathus striatus]